jgi:hypothetical protein
MRGAGTSSLVSPTAKEPRSQGSKALGELHSLFSLGI